MAETSTQEAAKRTGAMNPGNTGVANKFNKTITPFFAHSTVYNLVDPFGLGADLVGNLAVVQIVYDPPENELTPEAKHVTIAGFVSPVNEDLSDFFSTDAYRIGVEMSRVISELESRIENAEQVIAQKREDSDDVEDKVELLKSSLEMAKELDNSGWTHIILATAWRQYSRSGDFTDRLDLNFDFFDLFYPEKAFPIPSLQKGLGPRSFFIWDFFPEGKVVESELHGIKLWNRYRYDFAAHQFPKLRITFNHVGVDVLSQDVRMYGSKEKLRVQKKWPTVAEVVEQLEQELRDNTSGKEAAKARRRAMKWAERFLRRAIKLRKQRKQKKDKFAQTNEDAAEELMKAVRENLDAEQEGIIEEIENIKDPMSKKVDVLSRKAVKNRADAQLLPGDSDEDELMGKTLKTIGGKYRERAKKQLEDIKNADPDDPKLHKKVGEALKSNATLMTIGEDDPELMQETTEETAGKYEKRAENQLKELENTDADDPQFEKKKTDLTRTNEKLMTYGSSQSGAILDKTLDELSRSTAGGIDNMVSRGKWAPAKVIALFEANNSIGDIHQPNPETIKRLKDQNLQAMEERYKRTKRLDKTLKNHINLHVIFLHEKMPPELMKNPEIRDYVERLIYGNKKKPEREKKPVALETPNRKDSGVIKQGARS